MSLVTGHLARPALPSSEAGRRIWEDGERFQARQQSADKDRIESLLRERRDLLGRMERLIDKERRRKIARYRRKSMRAADPLPPITMRQIAHQVCDKYGLSWHELISERRIRHIVRARFEVFYRCHKETRYSLPAIGRFFGGKDHTTVMNGIRRHAELVDSGDAA